jgi:hypothetical protein
MSGITPARLTTKSFSICYYDGNTGEPISMLSYMNNTGKVKDTMQEAIDNKPEYNGLVMWDINEVKEEKPIAGKKRIVRGFWNTGNLATPKQNEIA